jgi:hypothetical protein
MGSRGGVGRLDESYIVSTRNEEEYIVVDTDRMVNYRARYMLNNQSFRIFHDYRSYIHTV